MANDLVKRFVKKYGSQRIFFYREEYAENPRYMTDEPLHCEDWSRNYSIKTEYDKKIKSNNACSWIRHMLERYGNAKEIFNVLKDNAKSDKHHEWDNALMYDKARREWILYSWASRWQDYNGEIHGNKWEEDVSFCCNFNALTLYDIVSYLSDEQIEYFSEEKYFTDGIKMMSYNFHYYGEISFESEFSTDSEGICWLEKDEFLKYSGCNEEYWKGKSLDEITWLIDAIKAWGDNDVYGFVVEDCIKSKIHKEYTNVDKEEEDYEEEQWEESDSCWGFYGDIDDVKVSMFNQAGININDFEEVSI